MSTNALVLPTGISPFKQRFGGLLKKKWFREPVLLWPTLPRRTSSNKAEDYGVFKPSLVYQSSSFSIYVRDIDRSST